MPLRTQAVCDRCGVVEGFGEKQSFPETPPPDWYGMKLTRRVEDSYTFTWGLLCAPCYAELKRWLRPSSLGHHVPPRAKRRGLLQGQLADRDALEAIFQFRDGAWLTFRPERGCPSLTTIRWSRHSRWMNPVTRSAIAFACSRGRRHDRGTSPRPARRCRGGGRSLESSSPGA